MIYSDLNIEPIDQGEDLWWVFHLSRMCNLKTFESLLLTFGENNMKVVAEQFDDANKPEFFRSILVMEIEGSHSIYFTACNDPEWPMFYFGMHAENVLPPHSPAARLNADLFLEYGRICYRELRPMYAFAENLNVDIVREDIELYHLTHICWAQMFGPNFVKGLDREMLINAPAWRNENLEDGGILYCLSATPFLYHGSRQYWNEARRYFKEHRLNPVEWSDIPGQLI